MSGILLRGLERTMRIIVDSTTKVVEVNGVPARVWEGHTESGLAVHCFITRIAGPLNADLSQFEAELAECRTPRNADIDAYPMRLLL
jgi:hypothetical protein